MSAQRPLHTDASKDKHFPTTSLLEFIAPPPGWKVDQALCASYSAHCSVIAAMLLAMAGGSDADGNGSKVALARAYKQLKGKVVFMVQQGRLAAPGSRRAVLSLLDRFIVPIDFDERRNGRSWHPKVCLIKFTHTDSTGKAGPLLWKLWIGSRNFTRDTSWDIGFSLTSDPDQKNGQLIPGVENLARKLSIYGGKDVLWGKALDHLKTAKWQVPRGLVVREICLLDEETGRSGLPPIPPGVTEAIAISPFLDEPSLLQLTAALSGAESILVSTTESIAASVKSDALWSSFQYRALPGSNQDADPEETNSTTDDDEAPENRGLHAKLLWFVHGKRATLYLGSPNLTQRGWRSNVEAYVAIEVPNSPASSPAFMEINGALRRFRAMCQIVTREDCPAVGEVDEIDELLEDERKTVAACLKATQRFGDGDTVIVNAGGGAHLRAGVALSIGRVGQITVPWPSALQPATLPAAPRAENSDLLQIKLSAGDRQVSWLQHAPFEPPLTEEERDLPLLQGYLGLQGLLDWLSESLTGSASSGGEAHPWDETSTEKRHNHRLQAPPSVEAVMAAWLRDPHTLVEANAVVEMARNLAVTEVTDKDAHDRLQDFLKSWTVLARGLR